MAPLIRPVNGWCTIRRIRHLMPPGRSIDTRTAHLQSCCVLQRCIAGIFQLLCPQFSLPIPASHFAESPRPGPSPLPVLQSRRPGSSAAVHIYAVASRFRPEIDDWDNVACTGSPGTLLWPWSTRACRELWGLFLVVRRACFPIERISPRAATLHDDCHHSYAGW